MSISFALTCVAILLTMLLPSLFVESEIQFRRNETEFSHFAKRFDDNKN